MIGAGKSYRAEQEATADGRRIYRQNGSNWWDGYDGDELVIIDDISETVSFRETLKVLDVYNYLAGVKGGHTYIKAEKIWVTASFPPSQIDPSGQLERRVTRDNEFPDRLVHLTKANRPDLRALFAKQQNKIDCADYDDLMASV